MQSYTQATVEGFVSLDPVLKQTKNGKSLCTFSIAVRHYSDPDSDPKVSFLEIETWDKLADYCSAHICKGKLVMVIGSLRQERWEGTDGKMRSKIKIVGSQIRTLDIGKENAAEKGAVSKAV
jgi:single-strand DNA-binding protein